MGKYLVRYLIFWLPAVCVAYFFNNPSLPSQALQWFFAFFMLLGWSVNTGMAAYHYPRSAMAALLTYAGFNILVIAVLYMQDYRSALYQVLRGYGGVFSFKPLDILLQSLKPFTGVALPWEYLVLFILLAGCLLGYIIGLVQRRVSPNPYSPRILRRR